MAMHNTWRGAHRTGEIWMLKIDLDLEADEASSTVDVWAPTERRATRGPIASLTPQEAREAAGALRQYADLAEEAKPLKAPARVSSAPGPQA